MHMEQNTNKVRVCPFLSLGTAVLLSFFEKNKALWEVPEVANKVTLVKIYLGNCYENVNIWHSLSHNAKRCKAADRNGGRGCNIKAEQGYVI